MCLLEADLRRPRPRADVFEWPAGDVAHPQRPHELQAWQTAKLIGAPLIQMRVLRALPHLRVRNECITELVYHRGDREHSTQALVQALLTHRSLPPLASGPADPLTLRTISVTASGVPAGKRSDQ